MCIKQRLSVVFVKIKFEIGELKNYSLGAVWRAKAVDFLGGGSLGAAYFRSARQEQDKYRKNHIKSKVLLCVF